MAESDYFPGGGVLPADRWGCAAEFRKMDPTWDLIFENVLPKFAKKVTLNGTQILKFSQNSLCPFLPKYPLGGGGYFDSEC